MRIELSLLIAFFFLFISCGDTSSTTQNGERENEGNKFTITAKAIDNFTYTDYVLSEEAEQVVANWEKYQELAIQISYLKKADLFFFNGDKELLKKFIGEFNASIPDELRTNAIVSRATIIETTLLKLNDDLTLDNIDGKVKLLGVKEVIVAFSNFNYQINKKLESDFFNKITPE